MILVFGKTGQVARALSLESQGAVTCLGRESVDFSRPQDIPRVLGETRPTLVINAVAYTAVDRAESERDLAFTVNAESVGVLAEACAKADIPLLHYSTDYVYSGTRSAAHSEDEPLLPENTYGESKAEGERRIRATGGRHLIFRTSWVYFYEGKNFVNTMLKLGREREELQVVDDQIGAPTSASEIARASLKAVDLAVAPGFTGWGTYNLAARGETSWRDFAEEIFRQARELGMNLRVKNVKAIPSASYPTPAKRPLNSRLNCEKLRLKLGIELPDWQKSLADVMIKLKE